MTRFTCVVVAVALSVSLSAHGDDKAKPAGAPPDFAKQGQPGPEHERLIAFSGSWTLTADGAKESGTAEYKSILGGRFVTETVKLPLPGVTFEWFGIYGFDKQKKKYTGVWVDNFDTTTESAEGDADAAGKVLTFKGQHADPRTGKPAPYTWRIARDADRLTIEMFEGDADKAVLAIRGTRKK